MDRVARTAPDEWLLATGVSGMAEGFDKAEEQEASLVPSGERMKLLKDPASDPESSAPVGLTDREFTRILDWPEYRVYRHEIDEQTRTLKLWVRRKGGNRVLVCSGCGGSARKIEESVSGRCAIFRGANTRR
jgi:hypothetical protein